MLIGLVPLAGDLADVRVEGRPAGTWRCSNATRSRGTPPSSGDYLFVVICIAIVLIVAMTPIVLLFWLLSQFSAV